MNAMIEEPTRYCLIGIVTYQREVLLRRAIDSAKQALPPNSTICVVDNSPSEESRRISEENPDVVWINSEDNLGCIVARGQLMGDLRYKYYVSLDDDAWFVRGDELSAALVILDGNPDVAVVTFDILTPDRPDDRPREREPYQVNSFIGCGHVLRLADTHAAGGYFDAVGHYGSEEKDLSLRLLDKGKAVVFLPGYHVWHDKSELGRDMFLQHRSEVCNELAFAVTRTPLLLLGPIFLRKLALHCIDTMRKRRWRSLWAGLALFVAHFGKIIRSRAAVRYSTIEKFQKLQGQ